MKPHMNNFGSNVDQFSKAVKLQERQEWNYFWFLSQILHKTPLISLGVNLSSNEYFKTA